MNPKQNRNPKGKLKLEKGKHSNRKKIKVLANQVTKRSDSQVCGKFKLES